jgi:HlyD family secretion protein
VTAIIGCLDDKTTGVAGGSVKGRRWVASVCAVVMPLILLACSSERSPIASTALVERATITDQVTASGSVAAASQNLGFTRAGRLTSLRVKVGDQVRAGQLLAKIDSYALRQVLKQQKANLAAQRAALDRITGNPAVSGARATLSQSQVVLSATRGQVRAVSAADDSAISRSRAQLRAARNAREKANDALDAAQDACHVPGTLPSACAPQVASASSAQASAVQGVEAAKTSLAAAEQKKKVDAAAGEVSVETSRQGVVTARNALKSAASDRPHNIDQQQALVNAAAALVRSAQKDVDESRLIAPVDGVVSAINGVVGEYLSPSSGTTALAPGSRAAIPGSAAVGGAAGAGGGGAAPTARPGGSQFLVLSSLKGFQVVIPFEESDAAKIAPKQRVSVTFDAIPGLTESGSVAAVAPSATAISGVISYYVAIGLEHKDPRLRDGQTARAAVTTAERENVLSVPNASVRRQVDTDIVVVVDPDGRQHVVSYQAGLVGPDRTEVLSGLSEGQRVVVGPGR